MRDMLISCLRENGIGCAVDDSSGTHRLRVMPESEKRAKEIIPRGCRGYRADRNSCRIYASRLRMAKIPGTSTGCDFAIR